MRSVAGPMACTLATIERYMEVLPEARPWEVDQHVAPVAWRVHLAAPGARRLRVGFLVDDEVVRVQPPIERAVREVIEALRVAGHEGMCVLLQIWNGSKSGFLLIKLFAVFEWDGSSHKYAYELWRKAIFSDGGEGCRKKTELTGEPLVEGMLVGKPEDTLTTNEMHQVSLALGMVDYPLTISSSMRISIIMNRNTSIDGYPLVLTH